MEPSITLRKIHAFLVYLGHAILAFRTNIRLSEPLGIHGKHFFKTHAKAHHLKTPGIRVGGAVPVLERRKPAGRIDDFGPWLQIQVISVTQHGLGAGRAHLLGRESFHRCFRAYRNKRRGGDIAVRGVDGSRTPVR